MPATQCWVMGDRKVLKAHGPLRLAKWASPKFVRNRLKKAIGENSWHSPLAALHMSTCTYVYCTCVHTHTYTKIRTEVAVAARVCNRQSWRAQFLGS